MQIKFYFDKMYFYIYNYQQTTIITNKNNFYEKKY
jgi:hypothetical protein